MIVVTRTGIPDEEVSQLMETFKSWGLTPERMVGKHKLLIGLLGDTAQLSPSRVQALSHWIEEVLRVEKPFKRASREFRYGASSTIEVSTPSGDVLFGENQPLVLVGGPCAVEDRDMIVETAVKLRAAGARFLRGGAYKPRTSPYSFQGHGESALELLYEAKVASGLGIVTEVMDTADITQVVEVADIIQIGARNMQNFALLKKVGKQNKPILLKRGMSATIQEWLMAAEYILAAGNPNVILCERGIRTFDSQYTRNTLDLSAIPVLRSLTHLPTIVDPSHGTGKSEYVPALAMAAVAAGADGLMIEVHPKPSQALSDGPQSLTLEGFMELVRQLSDIEQAICRPPRTSSPEWDLSHVQTPTEPVC